jgi:hypothetical protein
MFQSRRLEARDLEWIRQLIDAHPGWNRTKLSVAISAHQPTEKFRVVPGMKHDQSHAFQHALLNSGDQGVTDLLMGNMPPPVQPLTPPANVWTK